jgi:hypothetical protein
LLSALRRIAPILRREEVACLRGVPLEPHLLEPRDRLFHEGAVAARPAKRPQRERLDIRAGQLEQ